MQKKLIAIAVAGALGAPAVALAQTSTVQIYGTITYEYGIGDQGRNRPNVDYADTPGGSAIGFRGEEKLGGGLSAWFQCETSADVRAMDQEGWCTRNSAIGFKGAFGNLHFGRWDTPMKRALNQGSVGMEETGLLGISFVAFGGSGGADATQSADGNVRQRWKRREAGLTYYESPNFNGFQVLGAFSSGNRAADSGAVDGTTNAKPRIWSLGATYSAGPLALGAGYEKHNEFGALGAVADFDDEGWGLSAAYTFAGKVKLGGTYLDRKWETAPGRTLKKKTWTVGVNWAIAGPHSLQASYTNAGDSKGNSLVGIGEAGGGGAASGPDTGANDWAIAYSYAFSKRTSLKFGYHKTDNDRNAAYEVGNLNLDPTARGDNQSGIAFLIKHRF